MFCDEEFAPFVEQSFSFDVLHEWKRDHIPTIAAAKYKLLRSHDVTANDDTIAGLDVVLVDDVSLVHDVAVTPVVLTMVWIQSW